TLETSGSLCWVPHVRGNAPASRTDDGVHHILVLGNLPSPPFYSCQRPSERVYLLRCSAGTARLKGVLVWQRVGAKLFVSIGGCASITLLVRRSKPVWCYRAQKSNRSGTVARISKTPMLMSRRERFFCCMPTLINTSRRTVLITIQYDHGSCSCTSVKFSAWLVRRRKEA